MIKTKVKKFSDSDRTDLFERIWEIDAKDKKKGTWWWWFWIFFIKDKNNSESPKQLMILWSTKNEKEIKCNGKTLNLNKTFDIGKNNSVFEGVVAAWFFDGKKMHENLILEQEKTFLGKQPYSLACESKDKAFFYEKENKFVVKITKEDAEFVFTSDFEANNEFVAPTQSQTSYLNGVFSYDVLRMPRLDFTGVIKDKEKNEAVAGTAYFQKVIVNAPVTPWYWGIFHFSDGSILSYFNPYAGTGMLKDNATKKLFSKGNVSLKKGIYFFDKKRMKKYQFKNLKIQRKENDKGQPMFVGSAENDELVISFAVECYSHGFWNFEKKLAGPARTCLKYNEYPAKITMLSLQNKQGELLVSLDELGKGIGNVEHSWGFLH